jgi:hypothetical protein
LEITSEKSFTMQFQDNKKEEYDPNDSRCVPKSNPIVKPVLWKITEEGIKGNLLVFHMLPQTATLKFNFGNVMEHPNGPECDLFVRFVSFYINFC